MVVRNTQIHRSSTSKVLGIGRAVPIFLSSRSTKCASSTGDSCHRGRSATSKMRCDDVAAQSTSGTTLFQCSLMFQAKTATPAPGVLRRRDPACLDRFALQKAPQVVGHVTCRRIAMRRLPGHCLVDDRFQIAWLGGIDRPPRGTPSRESGGALARRCAQRHRQTRRCSPRLPRSNAGSGSSSGKASTSCSMEGDAPVPFGFPRLQWQTVP